MLSEALAIGKVTQAVSQHDVINADGRSALEKLKKQANGGCSC